MISQLKAIEDENPRRKRMYADLNMQADLLKAALGKKSAGHPLPGRQMRAFTLGQRREMAENAVVQRGAGIALAYRIFGVSETCYRYGPKLRAEKQAIEAPLVRAQWRRDR